MINKLLISFILFIFCHSSHGQITKEECQDLIDLGLKALDEQQYPQAVKKLTEAELLADKNHWPDLLWFIKNNLGRAYHAVSGYGEALGQYNTALTIIENNPQLIKKKIAVWNNIGTLYSEKGDNDKALTYYSKAYKEAQKYDSDYELFMQKILAANIASLYNEKGKLDEAKNILLETKSIQAEAYAMQAWEIIYLKNLYLRGNINEASVRADALLQNTQKNTKGTCYKCTLELLSEIYAWRGDIDKAITHTKKILTYNSEWNTKIETYSRLANLYHQKGDINKAFIYKDSVILAKDSKAEQINLQLFQINEIKYKIEQFKNQLKVSNEKQKGDRKFFIICIIFSIILLIAVYIGFRNQVIRQHQKRAIAENERKIIELELEQEKNEYVLLERKMAILENESKLEQERLKNKIDKKNRMLSANALYQSGRNELLEKIISSLSEMSLASASTHLKNYVKELQGHLKTDVKWQDFINHFEKVNPGFLKKIKEEHPELTQKDIRFICYLYMNLSTKEICAIFNITPAAFWKRKQRLGEKMDLKNDELYDYILNLV